MNQKKMIEVALNLNIEPSQEVLKQLECEFDEIAAWLEKLQAINVDDIEPMVRIGENFTSFLRDDIVKEEENIAKADLLANSKDSTKDFVKIGRVLDVQD